MLTTFLRTGYRWVAFSLLFLLLKGCADLAYYDQAISGHWQLLSQKRSLSSLLDDPATSSELRQRLVLARELRDFASQRLHLPDNDSYRDYADLNRPYAVYNVFAAAQFELLPYRWCFPIIGCVGYRGYFNHAQAQQQAERLGQHGYDIYVAGIPAYSTLGWSSDPLLNTFIFWPEGLLAELIFHELSHQRLYIDNDTTFNESFATAVGQLGAILWLQHKPSQRERYTQLKRIRRDFLQLVNDTRAKLAKVYQTTADDSAKLIAKEHLLAEMRQTYRQLKENRWQGFTGYDHWFAKDLNNAKLASVTTYNDYVPAFLALFAQSGNHFKQFFQAAEQLSALPSDERNQRLAKLQQNAPKQPPYTNAD